MIIAKKLFFKFVLVLEIIVFMKTNCHSCVFLVLLIKLIERWQIKTTTFFKRWKKFCPFSVLVYCQTIIFASYNRNSCFSYISRLPNACKIWIERLEQIKTRFSGTHYETVERIQETT